MVYYGPLSRGDKVAASACKFADVTDRKECFGDGVLPLALDVPKPEHVRQAVAQA